jgi:hypothetical protein
MGIELGDVYYPLAGNKGERFPYNDPKMTAVLEPVPATRGEHVYTTLCKLYKAACFTSLIQCSMLLMRLLSCSHALQFTAACWHRLPCSTAEC